jgi:hypothetical protein
MMPSIPASDMNGEKYPGPKHIKEADESGYFADADVKKPKTHLRRDAPLGAGCVGSQEQEVNWNTSQAIIAPVRVVTRRMTILTLLLALAIAAYLAFRMFGKI